MNDNSSPLNDTAFMDAVLDLVIPPGADGKMPGGGSVGITPTVVAAIAADSQFGAAVLAGLQAVRDAADSRGGFAGLPGQDRQSLLEAQAGAHPVLMRGLARYVFSAYYQHPRVLGALGQPARPPFPGGFEVEATDPELLRILEARARR